MKNSKRCFYEISPSRYLFNRKETPEEKVRQWVLFELLTGYGVHVNNLEIEHPVKIGTRTHRIDVLIIKEHKPFIVIECKRKDSTISEMKNALNQAISYADSNTIKAEFVVCTNGDIWWSKRKVDNNWESIPDIPVYPDKFAAIDLYSFLYNENRLFPLLHWTFRSIPAEEVLAYFDCLHWIFISSINKENYTRELWSGIEVFLRVLSTNIVSLDDYALGKLHVACDNFGRYFEKIGEKNPFVFYRNSDTQKTHDIDNTDQYKIVIDRILDFEDLLNLLYSTLEEIVLNSQKLENPDTCLLRTLFVLVKYTYQVRQNFHEFIVKKREEIEILDLYILICSYQWYKSFSENDTSEIQVFLEQLCRTNFGIEFPDKLISNIDDLDIYTEKQWNDYKGNRLFQRHQEEFIRKIVCQILSNRFIQLVLDINSNNDEKTRVLAQQLYEQYVLKAQLGAASLNCDEALRILEISFHPNDKLWGDINSSSKVGQNKKLRHIPNLWKVKQNDTIGLNIQSRHQNVDGVCKYCMLLLFENGQHETLSIDELSKVPESEETKSLKTRIYQTKRFNTKTRGVATWIVRLSRLIMRGGNIEQVRTVDENPLA